MSTDITAMVALGDVKTSIPPIQTKIKRTQYVSGIDTYLPPLQFGTVSFSDKAIGLGNQVFPFKRPLTGIYPINTPAMIMILENGSKTKGTIVQQTNKFILQNITKPHNEKFQIIETFGKSHVFFYDERTRIYSLQGVMLDAFYQSGDFGDQTPTNSNRYRNMWALGFQYFYNEHLRGWKLKTAGRIAALYTNGWLIKGYPINLVISKESTTLPEAVSFQMNWVIEEEFLLNATAAKNIYDGIKFDPALVGLVNKLNVTTDKYNEALANFNNATSHDKQSTYMAEYKKLELEITDLKTQFDNAATKLSPGRSVIDLNYE